MDPLSAGSALDQRPVTGQKGIPRRPAAVLQRLTWRRSSPNPGGPSRNSALPASQALAEVPYTPGDPTRNSAKPVLGVVGGGGASYTPPRRPSQVWLLLRRHPHYMPARIGRPRWLGKFDGGDPLTSASNQNHRARPFQANLCPIRRHPPKGVCAPSPAFPCSRLHHHTEMTFKFAKEKDERETTTDGDDRTEQRIWQFKGHTAPTAWQFKGHKKPSTASFTLQRKGPGLVEILTTYRPLPGPFPP